MAAITKVAGRVGRSSEVQLGRRTRPVSGPPAPRPRWARDKAVLLSPACCAADITNDKRS